MKLIDVEYRRVEEVLKASPLFSKISTENLHAMLEDMSMVKLKKAEELENNFGTKNFYILISGRFKVTQVDPLTGRSIAPFLLKEGDIFDVFSLLDGKEHMVFPIALDEVAAVKIPLEKARQWIVDYPEFNQAFLPYLGEKMRELEAFGTSIVFDDIVTRLSKLILRYASPEKLKSSNLYPVNIIHNLSDETISELIGSVRSVVNSQINKLKAENLILSARGKLSIKNLDGLIKKCDNSEKS